MNFISPKLVLTQKFMPLACLKLLKSFWWWWMSKATLVFSFGLNWNFFLDLGLHLGQAEQYPKTHHLSFFTLDPTPSILLSVSINFQVSALQYRSDFNTEETFFVTLFLVCCRESVIICKYWCICKPCRILVKQKLFSCPF